MTQPADVLAPAIGACLSCRQLFFVCLETPNCMLCGHPPAYTLPFPDVPPGLVESAPAEPVEPVPVSAPLEEPSPAVEESPHAVGEEPSEDAGAGIPSPVLALFKGIQDFMGGITEGIEPVRQLFTEAGAEAEEAATAVGRLSAVREFVEILWERFEGTPVAPAEPQPEAPAGEG